MHCEIREVSLTALATMYHGIAIKLLLQKN